MIRKLPEANIIQTKTAPRPSAGLQYTIPAAIDSQIAQDRPPLSARRWKRLSRR
ncbi:hypothetical protein ACNKHM_23295 [Shigella sonnei]